jgi:Zn/Cd-binding protein ZinT
LVVIAFSKGFWWGVAVLVFPAAEIIFAALHWRESKTPFLTNLLGGTAFVVLLVYMSVSTGRTEMLRRVLEVDLSKSEAQEVIQFLDKFIDPTESSGKVNEREKDEFEVLKNLNSGTILQQIDEKKIQTQTSSLQQAASGYKPIAVTKASIYIGKSMKVVGRNGVEHNGKLKKVGSDRLHFERWMQGGKFAFSLKTADIKALQVFR